MDFIVEEQKPDIQTSIWVEKYRPKTLSDYIGNDTVKESFQAHIDRKELSGHVLLSGPAGTGKTTLAKILAKNVPCDLMYINASAERGIDIMRDKMQSFASGVGFKPFKIVILDEADFLTRDAQASLRNMMETYATHTRFILTCNYPEQIITPILSRCQAFEIKPSSKKDIAVKLVSILQSENVSFTMEDIGFIVNTFYPDIRKIINFAHQSSLGGMLKIAKENAVESDFLLKIVSLLKTPSVPTTFTEIRKLVVDVDPSMLTPIYRYLMDNVNEYAKGKEHLVILQLADGLNQSTLVMPKVRDIPLLACLYKILKELK
jgi:replication factor C small subunit